MENITIYEMVDNIVQVVFYTHFSYITDQELRKDLRQIGFLKAYELLNNGNYDPTMSLRNFIYTGVRNEMHNTLYHLGKIPTVSLSDLDVYENIVGYTQVREYEVDNVVAKEVSDRFKLHGDFYKPITDYLIKIGILGEEYRVKTNTEVEYKPPKDFEDCLITLTLWKLYEKEEING